MAIDTTSPKTRRAILFGALGAVTASVAAAVGRVNPVVAADGDPILVGHTDSATSTTELDATGLGVTSFYASSDSGTGVYGFGNSYAGVEGRSNSGYGVYATTSATDTPAVLGQTLGKCTGVLGIGGDYSPRLLPKVTGVYGFTSMPHGTGVYGQTTDTTAETYGVHGRVAAAAGRGVFGWASNTSSGGTGVWGQSNSGSGVGVRGYAWDGDGASGKFGTGVLGSSGSNDYPPPTARVYIGVMGVADSSGSVGVYGTSPDGRGVVAAGSIAQLRLVPSTANHPSSGLKGDLFVDKSGRLWFCKGGATWKQVSLV